VFATVAPCAAATMRHATSFDDTGSRAELRSPAPEPNRRRSALGGRQRCGLSAADEAVASHRSVAGSG
jgi:hypothetical protein